MKRILSHALASLALPVLCSGCLFEHTNDDRSIRPETAIGSRATVMMPGQGPAPMTVFGQPTGAPAQGGGGSAMGTSSGSSSSSGSGSSSSQSGSSSSSGSSSGSGSSAGSGSSSGTGLPTPGSDDGMAMLGGAVGEGDQSNQMRSTPIIGPVLTLIGYPFWVFRSNEAKADRAAEKRSDEYQKKQQDGRPLVRTADDAERLRLQNENSRIHEQLEQQAEERGPETISAELAALERSLGSHAPAGSSRAGAPAPRPAEGLDRNHDGRPDLWSYREGGQLREELDEDHDGRPDRVLYYDGKKRLERTDEDLDHDGRYETITHYVNGEMSRRRADSDGDGAPDSWSFYANGDLVRNEVDRDKDGFRDLILIYADGALVREEDDRNRDGRPDLVSVYRDGAVIEKHDDMDFDGLPDISSYYENGKLVRRTVSSEGALEPWAPGEGS